MDSFFRKTSPALNWEEGHILGNGDLGAVVWGYPGEICVGLSKHDVNFLSNPEWNRKSPRGHTYHSLASRLADGEPPDSWSKELGAPLLDKTKATRGPYPISCGRLSLFMIKDDYPASIVRSLDCKKAECEIVCSPHPRQKHVLGAEAPPARLTVKVLASRNIVELRLSSESERTVQYLYSPGCLEGLGLEPAEFEGSTMYRRLPEETSFAVSLDGGACHSTPLGILGSVTYGGEAGDAIIRITVATSFESSEPRQASLELLRLPLETLQREHVAWWEAFWDRSSIAISEPWLQELWRFGVYAGGSGTRPDKSPLHLQGIWNQHRIPAWHCDMHFNANIQEAHWFAGPNNRHELAEALARCLLFDWRENFRVAAGIYSLPGLLVPFCADWKGRALGMWGHLSFAMGCTAWICLQLDDFMRYDGSGKWRREICEFQKEAATMYLDVLRPGADGKLHFMLSESPEQVEHLPDGTSRHVLGKDPALDVSATTAFFKSFIKLSKALELEDDVTEKVEAALPKLPAVPTHDGHFIDYETGYFHDGPAVGEFKWSHRHPSRLFPIFPGDDVNLDRDLALGVESFKEFRSYGERGFTSWSYAWQACVAAKLGLADLAEDRLNRLRSFSFGGGLMEHGSSYEPRDQMPKIFQLEVSLGAAAAVTGMMLQETEARVHLFPAVLDSRDASFKNLRIAGGALVSAKKEGRRLCELSVYAPQGGSFVFAAPWAEYHAAVKLEPGETRKLV